MQVFADVEKMEDETEKAVLTYRYLRGYTWEQICVKWNTVGSRSTGFTAKHLKISR